MFRNYSAAAVLAIALAGSAPAGAGGDTIVAKVDGKPLTERDMQLAETEIGSDLGNAPPEKRRRILIEYLIENQLLADAAESEKLGSGPSFDKRMAYLRRRALRESYFDKKIKTSVSEAAARTFFNDKIKTMKPEEEVTARHILVETEEEARDLLEQIRRGADFGKVAGKHSRDPGSRANGGQLGAFTRGQMVPSFEKAAFTVAIGEISEPVQSRFGWHLIKVEKRGQKPKPKFEDVKQQILNSMIHQRTQSVTLTLREKAKIEYFDEKIKAEAAMEKLKRQSQQKAFEQQIQQQQRDKK